MIKITNLYLALLFLFVPAPLYAESPKWDSLNNWTGTGFSTVEVHYPDGAFQLFIATITDDYEGKKVLEFQYFSRDQKECRASNFSDINDTVVKIFNTRIKMKVGCKKEAGMTYLSYYPTTEKGRKFIVKNFSLEKPVLVELQGHQLYFPSKGFVTGWNNYGGDAI